MSDNANAPDPVSKERLRRQKSRNWALFFVLLIFCILVYGVTMTKIRMGYNSPTVTNFGYGPNAKPPE